MKDDLLKDKIVTTINAKDDKTWFTLDELERLTGSTATQIVSVINSSPEFVRSSYLSEDKLGRYSTREHFNQSSSILQKLKGAFKNTLD